MKSKVRNRTLIWIAPKRQQYKFARSKLLWAFDIIHGCFSEGQIIGYSTGPVNSVESAEFTPT